MRWAGILALALAFALGLAGCDVEQRGEMPEEQPLGVGTDQRVTAACLRCHEAVAQRWSRLSSHNLVLGCAGCHADGGEAPGRDHVTTPACARCHSQPSHPSAARCVHCHDPHGSANAFLLRESIDPPSAPPATVHLTRPEGATPDGLVRAGVPGARAGSGVCEICHTRQRYYTRDGGGQPHHDAWCITCHDHQKGFRP